MYFPFYPHSLHPPLPITQRNSAFSFRIFALWLGGLGVRVKAKADCDSEAAMTTPVYLYIGP